MVVCRVKSYAEELVGVIDEKGDVNQEYKTQGMVFHHILFIIVKSQENSKKITIQMYAKNGCM